MGIVFAVSATVALCGCTPSSDDLARKALEGSFDQVVEHVEGLAPDVRSAEELVAGGWIADYSRYTEQDFRERATGSNPAGWYSLRQHDDRVRMGVLTMGFGETNKFPGYSSAARFRCSTIEATLGTAHPDVTTTTVDCPGVIRRGMPTGFHED